MKSFREIALCDLNEHKIMPKRLKPYKVMLFDNYLEFLNEHFKSNINVDLQLKKPNKNLFFGYIDLIGLSKGKYKIIVEEGYQELSHIGHEFCHLVQYKEGKLDFSKDETYVIWKKSLIYQ